MAQELLAELHRRGIRLRVVDGSLDVIAPSGAITPELQVRLKDAREDLMALVGAAAVKEGPGELTAAPHERYEPFPLTDLQHSYWIGRGSAVELGGVSSHYYFEVERAGLDPEKLSAAWRKVIERHDMLRMTVLPDGRQQVRPAAAGHTIPVADLRDLTPEARDEALAATRAELDHQVLPADAWPLFDIRASLLPAGRLRLHISLDVLILDGYSLFLLFSEWRRFYEQPDWRPEPLDVSYRDYVLHELAERDGARYAEDERYWLERLDTLPAAPDLPLAVQPGRLARTRFERRAGRLDRGRWQAVKDRARSLGLTPSNVLLAAYNEVLRSWSGQPDFTVNLTLFNRPAVHPRIGELVGDFTSVTLCEARGDAGETFAERVRAVQRQLLRDLDHSAFNGVRVLRERARRLGGGPGAAMPVVFTSALVLGGAQDDVSEGIRFFGEEVYALTQTPQVWLDHQVSEERGDLVFNWDAVPELFPARMLDDMFGAYGELLDRLAADPEFWHRGHVVPLPARQRAERAAANATAADIAPRTLGELVEEQAARQPDAPAVLAHDGELTYRQTVVHARRLARRLRDLGAETGELVAVVLDKGWEQVPAVLGVNLSGAAYLPIDPHWPRARREELLDQGRCRTVVTSAALRQELAWPDGVTTVALADEEVRAAGSEPLETGPAPEDLAYVIFTSGSTGRPKGVMIDNRSAANTLQDVNARFGIGPQDRVLGLSALTFDLSVYDVFGMLAAGGAVVLPAPGDTQDPQAWAELMARHGVTVWNSVPALMQAWTDAAARLPQPAPGRLRLALLSGDWIPVALPDVIRTLHPGTEVISLGGATEGSIWSIHFPIGDVPPEWVRVPYGRALANQTMSVLDERLEPSPVWATGEIFIGGAGVALGYWGDPERTAERFITHPVTGERLYRTGDLGRFLPGGDIEFLGRRDGQVKLNGYRIELGEIEAALLREPGVAEAVAGVAQNPATGRRQLVAHVVAADAGGRGAGAADQDPAAAPPTWRRAVEAGGAEVRRALEDLAEDLGAYRASWRGVEELCPLIMARTLASVGAFRTAGATATAVGIVALAKAKPGYTALIGQWLAVLAEQGRLRSTGRPGEYACTEPLDAAALDARIRAGFAELPVREDHRVLADYVANCAEHQVELLRGTVSPLELLIGGDSTAVTEALYATNPVSHLQNRVAARAVRAFVERSDAGRPLRILEVGAGTGATSALVLRELPSGRAHYSFTDVSAYFTERAKRRFRDYVFVDYGVFDVDRDPAAQGVAPGSVDVVIAANVLHDAKDLGRTLRSLRSALVPGGLLVAVEGTANSRVQMVSVGFMEGLGHHADQRELPLLEVEQWRAALAGAGFARVAPVPEGEAAVDVHVQHVLLAGTAEDAAALDPAMLAKALGELLPDYMVPHHILPVERIPLSANGKVDRAALPVPWDGLAGSEPVAPRDELETAVVGLWAEVLERSDFGVRDSFFELGGDSLHAVAILGRLREDFGLDLAADEGLELLFDNPTVAALAEVLRDRQGS